MYTLAFKIPDISTAVTKEDIHVIPPGGEGRIVAASYCLQSTNNAGAGAACKIQVQIGADAAEADAITDKDFAGGDLDDDGSSGPVEGSMVAPSATAANVSAGDRIRVAITCAGGDSAGAVGNTVIVAIAQPVVPA